MLILGVDGGGTKTFAAVADRAGALLGFAAGPATNPLNEPRWRDRLAATVAAALASLDAAALEGAAFGLPVHGEIAEMSEQQISFARFVLPAATVRNDVHTAHEGAFAGGPGVLLLAGTGSMCWAADPAGHTLRVGGWGDGFGDEGSAHWIGQAALGHTSQILDGRMAGDVFAAAILAAIGLDGDDPHEKMLAWFYNHPNRRPAVAAIAATVDALAGQNDPVAEVVLDAAADALALHVRAARRQLGLPETGAWCFVGGVARSAGMRGRLASRLGSAPIAPRLPPVGGALWRAAQNARWAPDEAWIDRLRQSLAGRPELA